MGIVERSRTFMQMLMRAQQASVASLIAECFSVMRQGFAEHRQLSQVHKRKAGLLMKVVNRHIGNEAQIDRLCIFKIFDEFLEAWLVSKEDEALEEEKAVKSSRLSKRSIAKRNNQFVGVLYHALELGPNEPCRTRQCYLRRMIAGYERHLTKV